MSTIEDLAAELISWKEYADFFKRERNLADYFIERDMGIVKNGFFIYRGKSSPVGYVDLNYADEFPKNLIVQRSKIIDVKTGIEPVLCGKWPDGIHVNIIGNEYANLMLKKAKIVDAICAQSEIL